MPDLADLTAAASCVDQLTCHGNATYDAFGLGDLNPMTWLGSAASAAVSDVWQAAMVGLWSAGLWLLQLAFKIIDVFTEPDLSATGPMGAVLPTTLWLGATVAVLMMFVQLATALVRRDGQSLGGLLLGIVQFGSVWLAYLGVAGGLVAAAGALARGILQSMLNVDTFSGVDISASWPREIDDATVATVLGILSLLLVIPGAFVCVLIMFVREAALIILVATAPISAAGLVNDTTKVWFWKSVRWFIACLLISPTAALVLGIGVKLSGGIVAGDGDQTAAAAGMAVVGAVVIAVGACCPMVVFRLLAFVEPGTASGAALRQSWSEAGGASGLMSRGGSQPAGSSAATESGSDGRSGGEGGAESQTQSRLAGMLGPVGGAMQSAASMAHRAVDIGSDILGQAGVGSPGYSMTPTDERSSRSTGGKSGGKSGGTPNGKSGGGDAPTEPPTRMPTPTEPPTPTDPTPTPPQPPTPPIPSTPDGDGGMPGGGLPGGDSGAAGGDAETAAAAAAV